MRTRVFRAKSMTEALSKVKRDFGPDAIILRARSFEEGGVLGYGGRQVAEITASKPSLSLPRQSPRRRVASGEDTESRVDGATRVVSSSDTEAQSNKFATLCGEIESLKSSVTELVAETRAIQDPNLPDELRDAHQRLIAGQVAADIAGKLIRRLRSGLSQHELNSPAAIRKGLAAYVESMLPLAEPAQLRSGDKPTVIALVGPTGVGKTTTIAKLAAGYRLRQNRKVGLITIDTYRIAAVDQLQTYARIIDVPLHVASDPEGIRKAIDELSDCDVIFIDTAGSSPSDEKRLGELGELVRSAAPSEIHLVLAANCGSAVLAQSLDQFSRMGVNRLIFTKLDEAVGFGVVLNCIQRAEAKLSYVTTGQEVPDDIRAGGGSGLADLIIDGAERWPSDQVAESVTLGM